MPRPRAPKKRRQSAAKASRPTYVLGLLRCGCVCHLTETDVARGSTACIGRYRESDDNRMQPIDDKGEQYRFPRRCTKPQETPVQQGA